MSSFMDRLSIIGYFGFDWLTTEGNLIVATLGDAASFAAVYNKSEDFIGVIRLSIE